MHNSHKFGALLGGVLLMSLGLGLVVGAMKKEDLFEKLCLNPQVRRLPGHYFRDDSLDGADDCRTVASCSSSGLSMLRCPPGLAFDVEQQTCQWEDQVSNCEVKQRSELAVPLLHTEQPVCPPQQKDGVALEQLACGDGVCIDKALFCDGNVDCEDGSDESVCDAAHDPNAAATCDVSQCKLPKCFCSVSGRDIPGGLSALQTPQMVLITFDDAVTMDNFAIFEQLFSDNRVNPNGCRIKGTFFVSHRYTNYSMVNELLRRGHDIATHSITHNNDPGYWTDASVDRWKSEMVGHKVMLEEFGKVPFGQVLGIRAPLLRVGHNSQFHMLKDSGFLFDSSMTAPYSSEPYWPYTMDFAMPHKCVGNNQKCPTRSYPGVWEMVLNEVDASGSLGSQPGTLTCGMMDSCHIFDAEQFYNVLALNFQRHFVSNRAPFGIYIHAAWLKVHPDFLVALQFWIDQVLAQFPETYFVTMSEAIRWMQQPTELSKLASFDAWKAHNTCSQGDTARASSCPYSRTCVLKSNAFDTDEELRMVVCSNYCPTSYPWLNDFLGRSPAGAFRLQ